MAPDCQFLCKGPLWPCLWFSCILASDRHSPLFCFITVFVYTVDSLSRPRKSQMTAYLEVKTCSLPKLEHLTTGKKYCGKEEKLLLRSNFSSFPQYFNIPLTSRVQLRIYLLNVVVRIIFSQFCKSYMSRYGYLEVFNSPLEFEITSVNCICVLL